MQQSVSVSASPEVLRTPWWPQGWWKIVDTRIGIVPIPVYVILVALLVGFTYTGDIKGEISIMIAVLVIGGFTCAEIGKRTPVLRNIGAAAIFATFVPSALAYYKLLSEGQAGKVEVTRLTRPLTTLADTKDIGTLIVIAPPITNNPSTDELKSLNKWIESGGLNFTHVARGLPGRTLDVVFRHALGVFVACFTDVVEIDFHSKRYDSS